MQRSVTTNFGELCELDRLTIDLGSDYNRSFLGSRREIANRCVLHDDSFIPSPSSCERPLWERSFRDRLRTPSALACRTAPCFRSPASSACGTRHREHLHDLPRAGKLSCCDRRAMAAIYWCCDILRSRFPWCRTDRNVGFRGIPRRFEGHWRIARGLVTAPCWAACGIPRRPLRDAIPPMGNESLHDRILTGLSILSWSDMLRNRGVFLKLRARSFGP